MRIRRLAISCLKALALFTNWIGWVATNQDVLGRVSASVNTSGARWRRYFAHPSTVNASGAARAAAADNDGEMKDVAEQCPSFLWQHCEVEINHHNHGLF